MANTYCKELILSEMNNPEPYFYYVMMAWPDENYTPEIYDEDLLRKSCKKLSSMFKDKSPLDKLEKPSTLFFLANVDRVHCGLTRLCSNFKPNDRFHHAFRMGKIKHCQGLVVDQSHVGYKLPSGATIKIRSSDLNLLRTGGITKVTFHIGFTMEGPLAYGLENGATKAEVAEMTAFQEKNK